MRKVVSIIFYCLGGFFVYIICFMGFIEDEQPWVAKLIMLGIFTLPFIIFTLAGAAIVRFENWKHSLGVIFLSGSGVSFFVIIVIISYALTPEFKKLYPQANLSLFNDYLTGFSLTIGLAALGIYLIKTSKKNKGEKVPQAITEKETILED